MLKKKTFLTWKREFDEKFVGVTMPNDDHSNGILENRNYAPRATNDSHEFLCVCNHQNFTKLDNSKLIKILWKPLSQETRLIIRH